MEGRSGHVEPLDMTLFVGGMGLTPIRSIGSSPDRIETSVAIIFPEIIMIPEESWSRLNSEPQTPIVISGTSACIYLCQYVNIL